MPRPALNLKAILWKRSLALGFVVLNLALIAFLVFDMPLGSRASMLPEWLQYWARILTDIGLSGWLLFGSVFVFLAALAASRTEAGGRVKRRANTLKNIAAYVFISVAASGLLANLLKRIIGRARPENYSDLGIFSFSPFSGSTFESFPSGHATTFGAMAMILCLLAPRYKLLFFVAGFWLAMTRVIVGAHYPSDVIVGYSFGAWFTWLMAYYFAKHDSVFWINEKAWPVLKQPFPFKWKTRRG